MPLIEICSRPLTRKIVIICRKCVDAAGAVSTCCGSTDVVIGPTQRILNHSREIASHVATQADLKRLAFQISGRFDLAEYAYSEIGTGEIERWRWCIHIAG